MSTVLRPVGPRPAKVYWVRRLVVLVGVVLVVALVWALAGLLRGGGDAPVAAATDQQEAPADGEAADASGDSAAGETAADDAASGPRACAGSDLKVTLATPSRAYDGDAQPTFTFAVTNTEGAPCTVDAGSGNLVVTVTSGSDRIWSSADCAGDEAEQLLLLATGAAHKETVTWDRTRSDEQCSEGLPATRPGTYQAVAQFVGATTTPAVFELR